jgi:hypothetical protein
MSLPPCGLYRTTAAIAGVPEGRLVYFHNHGDPGPGVYLPASWQHNRARFERRGHTLASPEDADALLPLLPEGFYAITSAFWCCEKRCRRFEPDMLVQLGYNGAAEPILFAPILSDTGLSLPERGARTTDDALQHLRRLHVGQAGDAAPDTPLPN